MGSGDGSGDAPTDSGICIPTGDEECDGKDNNCNGTVDESDPDGGTLCGDIHMGGSCKHGVNHCLPTTVGDPTTDTIQCIGYIGPTTETCNGMDDDCDGTIDDNIGSLG